MDCIIYTWSEQDGVQAHEVAGVPEALSVAVRELLRLEDALQPGESAEVRIDFGRAPESAPCRPRRYGRC